MERADRWSERVAILCPDQVLIPISMRQRLAETNVD